MLVSQLEDFGENFAYIQDWKTNYTVLTAYGNPPQVVSTFDWTFNNKRNVYLIYPSMHTSA
mgnify:CR=1 FL=1